LPGRKYLLKAKIISKKLSISYCTSFYSSQPLSIRSLPHSEAHPLLNSLLLSICRKTRQPAADPSLKIYDSITFFPEQMPSFLLFYVANEENKRTFKEKGVIKGGDNMKRKGGYIF
jgi:hypothetical protein